MDNLFVLCNIKTFRGAGYYLLSFSSETFTGKMALVEVDAIWIRKKNIVE